MIWQATAKRVKSQQGTSAGPRVLPVSAANLNSQPAWRPSLKISCGGKCTAMSLIVVTLEVLRSSASDSGLVPRGVLWAKRDDLMLCSTGRPLFPRYERIVGLGTMGGKSRECQMRCLKLHVMSTYDVLRAVVPCTTARGQKCE